MYEDEPSDRVHDVLADAIFGDHPLGRRVLGTAEVIGSIPIPDISAYHQARYVGSNLVVSASGSLEHERIVELVREHFQPGTGEVDAVERCRAEPARRGSASTRRRPSSTTSASALRASPRDDDRRFALSVMDTIFGGSTSSRLFREVREKRGLAYAVGSYSEQFVDRGTVAMYVGTREDNVAEACEIIGRELASLRADGVSAGRARARQGARQGPHGPRRSSRPPARMSRNARRGPLRPAAAQHRRADREDRGGDARRRRRARRTSSTRPSASPPPASAPTRTASASAVAPVSEALVA